LLEINVHIIAKPVNAQAIPTLWLDFRSNAERQVNSLKHEVRPNNILERRAHLAQITLRFPYKHRPVKSIYGNYSFVFWESYETHKYNFALWMVKKVIYI
jgi:hypothetical protein